MYEYVKNVMFVWVQSFWIEWKIFIESNLGNAPKDLPKNYSKYFNVLLKQGEKNGLQKGH